MIFAGIDEAGLGPALGPLCVGCVACEYPGHGDARFPWEAGSDLLTEKTKRGDKRILIADSKVVHSARGLGGLERGILPFAAMIWPELTLPCSSAELLSKLEIPGWHEHVASIPWYRDAAWRVPSVIDVQEVHECSAQLSEACAAYAYQLHRMHAAVLPARDLNRRYEQGMNKAEVMQEVVGALLMGMSDSFAGTDLAVTVDRQGGRMDYLPFLMRVFPGAWIETEGAGKDRSAYRIRERGRMIRIEFCVKAESRSFAVALASMIAKYLREQCMGLLNAWFSSHIPGLKPTAGYHGDAPRFLEEIAPVLAAESISREMLVRAR